MVFAELLSEKYNGYSLISKDSIIAKLHFGQLLPLTRHYHQCVETFWMGRDTGEVERKEATSKTN